MRFYRAFYDLIIFLPLPDRINFLCRSSIRSLAGMILYDEAGRVRVHKVELHKEVRS
jgi:hypothetical protein